MSDFDLFTGRPIRSGAEDPPRYWSDPRNTARDWHIQAAYRVAQAASLAREIERAEDPMLRHSLQVRLAALLGEPMPVYQERPQAAPAPQAEPAPAPTHDPEADRAAQRYLNKTRRGRRK